MNDQQIPAGLVVARNVLAVVGAVMLLLGLFAQDALGGLWKVPLWIGVLSLAVAAGFALVTTRWRVLPVGARVLIVIAVLAAGAVVVDLAASS